MKKCILVITDGIGDNPSSDFNAFKAAKKPNFDWLFENAGFSHLKTSGEAVGLPEGQMGNSEVGHMTIGSGRILYQNLVKIDRAIADGSLAKNAALMGLLNRVERVHIIGLYSDGGVHSHLNHFNKICKIAQNSGKKVFAHAITDGRDVSPKSAHKFISNLAKKYQIATICGRFYAMDRDRRWERVQSAYKAIAQNENISAMSPADYILSQYEKEIFDEFIEPASFCDFGGIQSGDGVVFINFRNDRAREICSALSLKNFSEFEREIVCENLITMTQYDDKFSFPVMFENDDISGTLSEILSEAGATQLHTAETEKYAHVTFFFNGGKEQPVKGEERIMIPSPKIKTYDLAPKMSAAEVTKAVISGIEKGFDFIVVNFANGDMVGHTGDLAACIKAVEAVDSGIGEILKAAKQHKYNYLQISDHGNCEQLRSEDGEPLTNHTTFDVFAFALNGDGDKIKINDGGLANVAATVLKMMELKAPENMQKALF